jgi:predicted transport protein
MKKGFDESPLRLNKPMRESKVWTPKEMKARGQALAVKALKIWPPLVVDKALVRAAELEEMKSQASRFSAKTLAMEPAMRKLFEALRPKILELGPDVVELFAEKSVVYRVFDFFLEILPRKQYLTLLLNLDFDECDVPHDELWDTTKYSYVANATEEGGVGFGLAEIKDIPSAMHYVQLAYNKVND